jgi:hypothetical protein
MRFAVLAQNETLEDLAARVYDVSDAGPSALRGAGKALSDANPFLRRIDQVPAGTVVAVPPLEGVEPAPQTHAADALPAAALAAQVRGAIALVRQRLASELEAELAESAEAAKLSRSREAKAAARERPELGDELRAVANAAESRAEAARELRKHQADAFARMEADLEELTAGLGPASEESSA